MYTITSGSSGNCTLIQAGETRILVDAGISGKKVVQGLLANHIDPCSIDAIVITHEHVDHVKGAGIYSRKFNTPIYTTPLTWSALEQSGIGKIDENNKKILEKEDALEIKGLKISPYAIYHDAIDPVGYIFEYKKKKITFATDLGKVDDRILEKLEGCNGLLLEFNHDVNMLEVGSYPYPLKKRVLSDVGHLSNEAAGKVLEEVYHKGLEWVVLGHLSHENNLPDLAYLTAKQALEKKHAVVGQDIALHVASRHDVGPIQFITV